MSCKIPYIENRFRLADPQLADKFNLDTFNTFKAIQQSKLFKLVDKKFVFNNEIKQTDFVSKLNNDYGRDIVFTNNNTVSVNVLKTYKEESVKYNDVDDESENKFIEPIEQDENIPQELLTADLKNFKSKLNKEQVQVFDKFIGLLNAINPSFKIEEKVDTQTFIDFTNSVIRINENASLEDFTEEIIHLYTELLPDDKLDDLRALVVNTDYYKDVLREYSELSEYQNENGLDYKKLQTEAVVKMINDRFHKNNVSQYQNGSNKYFNQIKEAFDKLMNFIKDLFSVYNNGLLEQIIEDITQTNISQLDLNKNIYDKGVYFSLRQNKSINAKLMSFDNIDVNEYNHVVIDAANLFETTTNGLEPNIKGLELRWFLEYHEDSHNRRFSIINFTKEQKDAFFNYKHVGKSLDINNYLTLFKNSLPALQGKVMYFYNKNLTVNKSKEDIINAVKNLKNLPERSIDQIYENFSNYVTDDSITSFDAVNLYEYIINSNLDVGFVNSIKNEINNKGINDDSKKWLVNQIINSEFTQDIASEMINNYLNITEVKDENDNISFIINNNDISKLLYPKLTEFKSKSSLDLLDRKPIIHYEKRLPKNSNSDITKLQEFFTNIIAVSEEEVEVLFEGELETLSDREIQERKEKEISIKKAKQTIEVANKVLEKIKWVQLNFQLKNNIQVEGLTLPEFKVLNEVKTVEQLVSQMVNFVSFLNYASDQMYLLNNKEWDINSETILQDLNSASNFIEKWSNIVSSLQQGLLFQKDSVATPIIEKLLASVTGITGTVKKQIEETKKRIYTDKIHNDLVIPFNAKIINTFKQGISEVFTKQGISGEDIQEVLDLLPYSLGEKDDKSPVKYSNQLRDLFVDKVNQLNTTPLIKKLLIDKFANELVAVYDNSLTKNIVENSLDNEITMEDFMKKGVLADGKLLPFIDQYLTGLRFANDPLLAYAGNLMDSINYDVSIGFNETILNPYRTLYDIINSLGGEVEVGKALTMVYNLTEIETYVKEGVTYSRLITRPTKMFKNKHGDYYNWDTGFKLEENEKELLAKYELLEDKEAKNTYNQLTVHKDNIKTLLSIPFDEENKDDEKPLLELFEKIDNEIKETNEKWFFNKYSDSYNDNTDLVYDVLLKDLTSLGIIKNKEGLKKELKEFNDGKYALINQKNLLINRLNLESNKESFDVINSINNQIQVLNKAIKEYSSTELGKDNYAVVELSKRLSVSRKDMYDKKESLKQFYSDLEPKFEGLPSIVGLSTLRIKIKKQIFSDYPDENMIKLHLIQLDELLNTLSSTKLSNNTELSKIELEKILKFKIFLENNISYSPNDTYYNERTKLFNKRTKLFIEAEPTKYNYSTPNLTDVVINSLDEITLDSLETNDEYYLMINTYTSPTQRYVKVKAEKKNNKVRLNIDRKTGSVDSTQNTIDINLLWEQIFEITNKYRNENGYIVDVSFEDQLEIKDLQQQIIDESFRITSELGRVKPNSDGKAIYTTIKAELETVNKSISDLQRKFTTDELTFQFANRFSSYQPLLFPNNLKTFSDIKNWLDSQTIDTLRGYRDNIDKNPEKYAITGDKEILEYLEATTVIAKWKEQTDKTELQYTYNFIRTVPKSDNIDYFNFTLNNHYSESKLKEEYLRSDVFKDVYGKWIPKFNSKIVQDLQNKDELVKAYKEIQNLNNGSELMNIHEKWVEQIYINKQKENKNNSVGVKGLNGYKVATLYKQNAELGYFTAYKKAYDSIMGKINPLENGLDIEETEEDKRSWKEKVIDFFNMLFTTPMNQWRDAVRGTKKAKYKRDYIPIFYTGYMNGDDVTDDIFTSTNAYMHDLIKAKYLHDNNPQIVGLSDYMKDNAKNSVNNRQERFQKYIDTVIYRKGTGGNGWFSTMLRVMGNLLVFKSQTIFNFGGNTKNITSGLIANYINSGNTNIGKFGLKKLKTDLSTTGDAAKWAFKIINERQKLQEQSVESYITYLINPQLKNVHNLAPSSLNFGNYTKGTLVPQFFYAGIEGGETWISFQIMTNLLNQLHLEDSEGNQIDVKGVFEKINGEWKIKEGIKHKSGELLTLKDFNQISKEIKQVKFNTIGHNDSDKGGAFYNTNTSKLLFFSNYLIPLFIQNFTVNRNDFVTNRMIKNHNASLVSFLVNTIKYLYQYKQNYWEIMNDHEKRNVLKALVMYSYMAILFIGVKFILGFDPEDEDKYKDLKDNSNAENFLLYVSLKTMSELDSQSLLWDSTGDDFAPVITKNLGSSVQIKTEAENLYKMLKHLTTLEEYKKGNKELDIETGDLKFTEDFKKNFIPTHNRTNFGYMTEQFLKMQNK